MSSPSWATVNWSKKTYFQNWDGLNDSIASTEIKDSEATDLQNVTFDVGGAIKKRNGYSTIPSGTLYTISGGTSCVVTGLYVYRPSNGNRYLVAVGSVNNTTAFVSEKTYQIGGGLPSGTFINITGGTLPASGYSNNNLASFTVASDTLVMALPASIGQQPFIWTGSGNITTLASGTYPTLPVCSLVAYHKNLLFTNDVATGRLSRLHYSDLNSGIYNFPVLNFIDVGGNDGTQIRAIISAFNALYIFKDKSIWCLTGDNQSNFVLQKFVDGIGTLSPHSVGVIGNYMYFVDQQGNVDIYDGVYVINAISNKIRGTIGGLNFTRTANTIALPFSTYRYTNYDFYVATSLVSSSQNNIVLLYDSEKKAWTKFSGINANAWCLGDSAIGQNIIIFGDYEGYIHSYPSTDYIDGQVHNSIINAFYQTKWFRYPEVSLGDKYWMLLKTYALSETNGSTLSISCGADYNSGLKNYTVSLNQSGDLWDAAIWDLSSWVGTSLIVDRQEPNLGTGMFQIKYSNANANEGFTVNGFEVFIQPQDRI